MKKNITRILFYFLLTFAATALELTVPQFTFGLLAGKRPNEQKFSILQESSIGFRLLHNERFYSDLNLSFHIPDILRFFHPQQQARTLGQFAFVDFSLNFPQLGSRPLYLALFTGRHQSLTGEQYGFQFLKHTIRPVKMRNSELATWFLPPDGQENIGISFAGLISNTGYLGASFGWNAQIRDKQEYGIYMQGGGFSNSMLTNAYCAFHITDKAQALSLSTALSMLFTIHDHFSIFTQAGLHKTNLRSTAVAQDIAGNIFVFFEPRVHLDRIYFDFTFFASKIRDRRYTGFFPTAPLIPPPKIAANELYGGLNLFCGFGSMELDKLQGGIHLLTAANLKKIKDTSLLVLAATPFFTINLGPCDLDIRITIYPLSYKQPSSMVEGKIALKRDL